MPLDFLSTWKPSNNFYTIDGTTMTELKQDGKLDLNVATFKQLKGLCKIGSKLAQQIIDRRPFKCIDDLKIVPGIGKKRFDKLEEQCVVHGNWRPPSGFPSHVNTISFLDPRTEDHICQYISAEEFQELPKRGFLIFHVNAGCYRSSLFEMEKLIASSLHLPDIVCVSDTGNRNVSSSFLNAYMEFKFPEHHSRLRGKGVAIFVKKSRHFSPEERLDLNLRSDDCDNLWIELSCPKPGFSTGMWQFHIIIGVVYRNPSTIIGKIETFRENLQNVISKIKNEGKIFYILGDFNIDVRKYNEQVVQYCKMLEDENCKLLITKPTRVGIKCDAPGLLDHIYTNDPDLVHVTSGIVETHNVSDHYPIYCWIDNRSLSAIEKKKNARRNLKLRRMLQPSVYRLKTKGIPYNPFFAVSRFDLLELEIHKDLERLTKYQLDFHPRFRQIVFEVEIPGPYSKSGLSIVEIFGREVPHNKLEKIFCGLKQRYIIPVYIYQNERSDSYKKRYTIANTVNGLFYEGGSYWVFVPVGCKVLC